MIMRACAAALGTLSVCLFAPTTAAERWWDGRWEARIPITVEAADGVVSQRPVILPWRALAGEAAGAGFRLGSLRLVRDGQLVPFQFDHRNAAGDLVGTRDFSLDPQDEIVFSAAAGTRAVFHLYLSSTPMPPATFADTVSATPNPAGQQAHYSLASAGLAIDVQGTGLLDHAANVPANHALATVVGLRWKGQALTGQGTNWSVVMNAHPFPSGPENRWRAVKLVVDGPVRKIVATTCAGSTIAGPDGTVMLRADVTRHFAMYAGAPLYDVEDRIACSAAQGAWTATYTDRLVLGHRPGLDDILVDASSGSARRIVLTDRSIPLTADGRFDGAGGLTETAQVGDGWYAWLNAKEQLGLAVFYGSGADPTPARIGFSAGWAMWSLDNRMAFEYAGLEASAILRHRFRVVGLDYPAVDAIAREYHLWATDRGQAAGVGPLERRPP